MSFWTLDVNQTEMSQDHCLTTSRGNMHGKNSGSHVVYEIRVFTIQVFCTLGKCLLELKTQKKKVWSKLGLK